MDIRYGYEVWQDGEAQAWGEASTAEEALREADHCAMMYGKDGPVILRLNTRTEAYRADWEAQMNIEITDKGRAMLQVAGLDTGRYFSQDGNNYEEHDSLELAKKCASDALDYYRDEAADGWNDESLNISYGVVLGGVSETERRPATPDDGLDPCFTTWSERTLISYASDALRYRWLRDACGLADYKEIAGSTGPGMLPSGAKLDAAIDAAMGASHE